MLKKIIRFSIIALIQVCIVGLLAMWIAPMLINNTALQTSIADFINSTRLISSIIRMTVYAVLFFIWPWIVSVVASRYDEVSDEQIQSANKARWFFVGSLFLLEAFYWLRSV